MVASKGEQTCRHRSLTVTTGSDRFTTTKGFRSSKGTRTTGRRTKLRRPQPADGAGVLTAVARQSPLQSTPTMLPTQRRETRKHPAVGGTRCRSLWCTRTRVRKSSMPKNKRRGLAPLHLGHWTRVAPTSTPQTRTLSLGPQPPPSLAHMDTQAMNETSTQPVCLILSVSHD